MGNMRNDNYQKIVIELYVSNEKDSNGIVDLIADVYKLKINEPLFDRNENIINEFIIKRSVERWFPRRKGE